MKSEVKSNRLRIGGMTCLSCQNKIERKLQNTAGVQSIKVSYIAGTADITYDTDIISLKDISAMIQSLDYQLLTGSERQEPNIRRVAGILIIVVSLYVLLQQFGILNLLVPSQLADTTMGYGMLFVIGLITSVHCIAMCGGINLSQCIPHNITHVEKKSRFSTFQPAFLYNLGRVISYTAIGFILGFIGLLFGGGTDAVLPTMFQGILKLIAGVFMVIMGINMLGLFPWLRNLQPRMPIFFARMVGAEKAKSKSPLIVGLLNGLMPCGPLQSMQIVALASGNPFAGALSMFLFSMGTVPLMLGLGSIVSALGKKFTQKVMNVGAVLVVVLGLAMLSQGGSLSGFLSPDLLLQVILALCAIGVVSSIPFRKSSYKVVSQAAAVFVAVVLLTFGNMGNSGLKSNANTGNTAAASDFQMVDGEQVVNSTLVSGRYPNITVQVGTPVKWIIHAPKGSINGCNNRMFIQDYGIEYSFMTGDNVIEFTPTKTGNVQYSCWMGMIRGNIMVTDAGASATTGGSTETAANEVTEEKEDTIAKEFTSLEPVPAGYAIPTDNIAISKKTSDEENGVEIQEVTVEITDQGFSPAIIVVQSGLEVKWHIINKTTDAENGTQLLIPTFAAQLDLLDIENQLYFYPDASFDFSTGDSAFYGYVKVVDDISKADIEKIKTEVNEFVTLKWPPETFQAVDGGASCH